MPKGGKHEVYYKQGARKYARLLRKKSNQLHL